MLNCNEHFIILDKEKYNEVVELCNMFYKNGNFITTKEACDVSFVNYDKFISQNTINKIKEIIPELKFRYKRDICCIEGYSDESYVRISEECLCGLKYDKFNEFMELIKEKLKDNVV